ncbi:MAG: transporter associated domain-containing protein, partial [Eubacteriales bacterium]
EEIVGNIYDESDKKEVQEITKLADDSWRVAGTVPLDELSDELKIELDVGDEDYGTLGGLVFSCLSQIPDDGSHPVVQTHGLEIRVDEITDHRIEWATVKKLPEPADEEDNSDDNVD